jgi:hypothetical protein
MMLMRVIVHFHPMVMIGVIAQTTQQTYQAITPATALGLLSLVKEK